MAALFALASTHAFAGSSPLVLPSAAYTPMQQRVAAPPQLTVALASSSANKQLPLVRFRRVLEMRQLQRRRLSGAPSRQNQLERLQIASYTTLGQSVKTSIFQQRFQIRNDLAI